MSISHRLKLEMVVLYIKTKPLIFLLFILVFFIVFFISITIDEKYDDDYVDKIVYNEIIIKKDKNIRYCGKGLPNLKKNIINQIDENVFSFDQVEENLQKNLIQLEIGGYYFTINNNDCLSDINMVLIVPYYNSTFQSNLVLFLNHMHLFLSKQKINYAIYLVQSLNKKSMFNKGYLMNVGFIESIKDDFHMNRFNCFVFHDLNILPMNNKILYKCENEAPIQFLPFENKRRNFGRVILI
jgi:hypothetical protein